jgi:hypothetical protein
VIGSDDLPQPVKHICSIDSTLIPTTRFPTHSHNNSILQHSLPNTASLVDYTAVSHATLRIRNPRTSVDIYDEHVLSIIHVALAFPSGGRALATFPPCQKGRSSPTSGHHAFDSSAKAERVVHVGRGQ